jgi:DNA-binding GntR family transcriptional regulator
MSAGTSRIPGIVPFSPSALSLGEQVAIRLGERIIFGDIPPGQRITEESIEKWSGVSRSPVREAFRLMERDGLVRRETHRGVTVTTMDAGQLDDIYRMRVVLEAQAAELAAARATKADIDVLEHGRQKLTAAFTGGDPRQYFRENLAFSETIHIIARAEKLQEILRIIGGQALRFRFLAYQRSDHFTGESLAGAGRILDAIRDGDAARAAAVTAALLQSSWEEIRALLDAPPVVTGAPKMTPAA